MVKLLTRRDGRRFLRAKGGVRNRDTIAGGEVEVFGKLKEIDEVTIEEPPIETGQGERKYRIFKDNKGFIVAESYCWTPAPGYSWEEEWEIVERKSPEEVEKIQGQEVVSEEEL